MHIRFHKSIVTFNNNKVIKHRPKLWDFIEKKYKEMIYKSNHKSFKYLGVDVNLNLNWKENNDRISKKISFKIKKLMSLNLDIRIKIKILNQVVVLILIYSIQFINNNKY